MVKCHRVLDVFQPAQYSSKLRSLLLDSHASQLHIRKLHQRCHGQDVFVRYEIREGQPHRIRGLDVKTGICSATAFDWCGRLRTYTDAPVNLNRFEGTSPRIH